MASAVSRQHPHIPGSGDLSAFCRDRGIATLALFGSALRDDFHAASDIDLLVEFRPETRIGLMGVARLELDLSLLFGGRKVDLRTRGDLSPYIRGKVEGEARLLVDLREEAVQNDLPHLVNQFAFLENDGGDDGPAAP